MSPSPLVAYASSSDDEKDGSLGTRHAGPAVARLESCLSSTSPGRLAANAATNVGDMAVGSSKLVRIPNVSFDLSFREFMAKVCFQDTNGGQQANTDPVQSNASQTSEGMLESGDFSVCSVLWSPADARLIGDKLRKSVNPFYRASTASVGVASVSTANQAQLCQRVEFWLKRKREGRNFVSEMLANHKFHNPSFAKTTLANYEVEEYASCFDKSLFDPSSLVNPRKSATPEIPDEKNVKTGSKAEVQLIRERT